MMTFSQPLMMIATVMAAFACCSISAFAPTASINTAALSASSTVASTTTTTNTALAMANDQDFMRWARASRSAQADDNVVVLNRPLGLVLNEDEQGNVYVETVAPKGNAARTGKVKEGDIVTMCSATFGDEMWSTRGVGLTRVLAAIRVRAGPTVKLVFESSGGYKKKKSVTEKQIQARQKAAEAAQKKKDALLSELESDEKRLKKGKFFGLF